MTTTPRYTLQPYKGMWSKNNPKINSVPVRNLLNMHGGVTYLRHGKFLLLFCYQYIAPMGRRTIHVDQ